MYTELKMIWQNDLKAGEPDGENVNFRWQASEKSDLKINIRIMIKIIPKIMIISAMEIHLA